MDRELLAKNFRRDAGIEISLSAVNALLDACAYAKVPKRTVLVKEGEVNSNLYITINGVNRIAYFDGVKEVTFGFGDMGTIFLSPMGFVRNHASHLSLITVTDCEMLICSKTDLERLVANDNEVCNWMFHLAVAQMESIEFKIGKFQKNAKEKYIDLIKGRDMELFDSYNIRHVDINKIVSDRVLASYLDVIPSHLSNIKKDIIEEERRKTKQ